MTTDTRKIGTVARLFRDRVFGFIHCPADDRDYFFHQAQLDGCTFTQISDGDQVSFLVGRDANGRVEAQEIRREDYQPRDGRETRAQLGLPPKSLAKPPGRYRRRV